MQRLTVQPQLVDRAYGAILDEICTGRLAPGQRVVQDELAERLAVSRQPVL
jgi:DNA-binding GntR family transcriptional regulator